MAVPLKVLDPPRKAYDRYLAAQPNRTELLWQEATGRCWRCKKQLRPWQGEHRCR